MNIVTWEGLEGRDDLRRVDDLGDLCACLGQDSADVAPALKGYVSGKLRYHLHFGVKAYDHDREVSYYCAWLRSYVYA